MQLTLSEHSNAGRIGLRLLATRARLADARQRGDLEEVERLEQFEHVITADLIAAVTLPPITFKAFGISSSEVNSSTGRAR